MTKLLYPKRSTTEGVNQAYTHTSSLCHARPCGGLSIALPRMSTLNSKNL